MDNAQDIANLQLIAPNEFESRRLSVHKFGGSSLATVQRLKNVVDIIQTQSREDDLIVVSANGKVTDWLFEVNQSDDNTIARIIKKIENYYCRLVSELLIDSTACIFDFDRELQQIRSGELSEESVLAFGEIWSARLLTELLNQSTIPALFTDARLLLKTDSIDCFEQFDAEYFQQGLQRLRYGNYKKRLVITGYIAKNLNEETITLGRNGSDYSASLLAYLRKARQVTLWTDVSGIYSADPRLVTNALPLSQLSFDEARALSAIGNDVLHQKTINPLQSANIPLRVKSSISPDYAGTLVSELASKTARISSIALKENLVKISLSSIDANTQVTVIHELFERHINAITLNTLKLNTLKPDHPWSLLISQDNLSAACEFLSDKKLLVNIDKQTYALVSIIGFHINKQTELNHYLERKLSQIGIEKTVLGDNSHEIKLVLKDERIIEQFKKIYELCFAYQDERQSSTLLVDINELVVQGAVA